MRRARLDRIPRRRLLFRCAGATLSRSGDGSIRWPQHRPHRPYGLGGGGPGAYGKNVLDPGMPTEEKLHAKLTMTLRRGQVFRHDLPGAGGHGDALSRDLALVARDLCDGLVTIAGAARDYGVIARGDPPELDFAATAALRSKLRA